MILPTLALFLAASSADASEFFPLKAGTRWQYQATGTQDVTVDSVGEPAEIGGERATPILAEGKYPTYYRVSGDTVFKVAEDPSKPISPPMPIFKLTDSRVAWHWNGLDDGMPLSIDCAAKKVSPRTLEGSKRTTIEVTTDAQLGDPKSGMKFKQIAYYAQGVGLVEMSEEMRSGRTVTKRGFKLVKFVKPDKS